MAYTQFPATDENFRFPPQVMDAIAKSPEIAAVLPEPMTLAEYNALPVKVPGKLYVIIPG